MAHILSRGAAVLLGLIVAVGGLTQPAAAATAPPAVSQLQVDHRYDHTLMISWHNPTAGASAVVRLTRGRTPAATPTAGYAVPVNDGRFATARPLGAGLAYTFAVWVRDGDGHYSARTTLTTSTRADVTPPPPLESAKARWASDPFDARRVQLSWNRPEIVDFDGVRIVRNTTATPTGGTVLESAYPGSDLTDYTASLDRDYWYYFAVRDTSGNLSPYVSARVERAGTISGTITLGDPTGSQVTVYDGSGALVADAGPIYPDGSWSVQIPPGTYTVCGVAATVRGEPYTPGCWNGTDVSDYDHDSGLPPDAVGTVVVTTGEDTPGVNLSLHGGM